MEGAGTVPGPLLAWHWWALGAGLLLLELALPGVLFVWLALAAFALGLLSFVLPLDLISQLVLFAGLSVASVVLGRRYVAGLPSSGERLNTGTRRLLGRTVTVTAPIVGGVGRVRVGDSEWRASGPDLPAGSLAEVVDSRGATLVVRALPPNAPGLPSPTGLPNSDRPAPALGRGQGGEG